MSSFLPVPRLGLVNPEGYIAFSLFPHRSDIPQHIVRIRLTIAIPTRHRLLDGKRSAQPSPGRRICIFPDPACCASHTPIGHTTNLASRMQAAAPTGSIAISEQTRKFAEGYFQLKLLGPTKVKGVSEPVNVYEVTGLGPLRTRLQRSAGPGLSKFVGRQAEMDSLKRAAEQAKAGRGQIVAAMAEAGVGKSRLLFEFKAISQSGWMVLEAFSVSHGKVSACLPVSTPSLRA